MTRRNQNKELLLPSMAMIGVEGSTVVVGILVKASTLKGMSYLVFTAYTYILNTLVFFLLAAFFKRRTMLPAFKFPLFSRIFFLGLLGFSSQLFIYKGLELSSPTLASAISNLVPAFTFILALLFRVEKVALKSSSSQAKIIGTLTSIFGACVIVFYKGSKVISSSSSSSAFLHQSPLVFLSTSESSWIMGGFLEALGYLLVSFGFIIQSQISKIYPEDIIVNFFYNLFGTVIALPTCLLAEPNLSSWRLTSTLPLVAVLYTGVFGFSFLCVVHMWCVRLKGPVFVASFKPTSIVITVVMSAIFLGEAVFLGSVMGAIVISTGLYCVLWGKAKEEEEEEEEIEADEFGGLSTTTINGRVPLLQTQNTS